MNIVDQIIDLPTGLAICQTVEKFERNFTLRDAKAPIIYPNARSEEYVVVVRDSVAEDAGLSIFSSFQEKGVSVCAKHLGLSL